MYKNRIGIGIKVLMYGSHVGLRNINPIIETIIGISIDSCPILKRSEKILEKRHS